METFKHAYYLLTFNFKVILWKKNRIKNATGRYLFINACFTQESEVVPYYFLQKMMTFLFSICEGGGLVQRNPFRHLIARRILFLTYIYGALRFNPVSS